MSLSSSSLFLASPLSLSQWSRLKSQSQTPAQLRSLAAAADEVRVIGTRSEGRRWQRLQLQPRLRPHKHKRLRGESVKHLCSEEYRYIFTRSERLRRGEGRKRKLEIKWSLSVVVAHFSPSHTFFLRRFTKPPLPPSLRPFPPPLPQLGSRHFLSLSLFFA